MRGQRQSVTGIVVNEGMSVPSAYRKKLQSGVRSISMNFYKSSCIIFVLRNYKGSFFVKFQNLVDI